jgi:GT2 family glycosyltransferase
MHETLRASPTHHSLTRPALSIVVTSWNTRNLLRELLQSLAQFVPGVEVIVVDNASVDGSADLVAREFPEVALIRNVSNLGYAVANNQGIRVARGSFVLLLGSDTRVIDGSLQKMASYLEAHTCAGAVACRLLNPDGTPQRSCRRFPRLRDAIATYLSLDFLAGRYNLRGFDFYATQPVEQPAATCLMVRRSVLDRVGLLDERYSILYNDVDLCRRIRSAGWEIMFLGDAEIIHHGSQSTTQAPSHVRLEMYRNILEYFERTFGKRARLVLMPILLTRLAIVTRSVSAFRLLSGTGQGGVS